MGFLIGAAVTAIFGLTLLIAGIAIQSEEKQFEATARPGKAEVVGYDRADQSDWYTLLVSIQGLDDGKLYNCKSGKINIGDYPKGTVVDVIYSPQNVAGINVVEVRLASLPPTGRKRLGSVIHKIALALLVIAGILIVPGLLSII